MGSVDPLDVGIVLAIPAFVGIVGSYFYTPLLLLAVPYLVAFVIFGVWAFCSALSQVVVDLL